MIRQTYLWLRNLAADRTPRLPKIANGRLLLVRDGALVVRDPDGTESVLATLGGAETVSGVKTFSARPVFSIGSVTSAVALDYAATLAPDCDEGLLRTITMTGDLVVNVPTNAAAGLALELLCTASGGDRELTFHASIKAPTGESYEATVASGSVRYVRLFYTGSAWIRTHNVEFA